MTQEEFEEKWLRQPVRITTDYFRNRDGTSMKGQRGIVTAALLEQDDVIFAVMFDGYEMGKTPEKWITFHFGPELAELVNFEIVE